MNLYWSIVSLNCHLFDVIHTHKLLNEKMPSRLSRGLWWQKQIVHEKVWCFWQWLRSLVRKSRAVFTFPLGNWFVSEHKHWELKPTVDPAQSHFPKGSELTTTNVVLYFFVCSAGLLAFLLYSNSCSQDSCLTSQLAEQKKYTRDSCLIASSSWIGSAIFFFLLFCKNSQEFSLQREVK